MPASKSINDFVHVEVTANKSDTEAWRIVRLHRVIGYVCALSDSIGYDVASRISSVHDHKGILRVVWRGAPSDAEKSVFTTAWLSGIGDGTDNVGGGTGLGLGGLGHRRLF